MYETKPYFYGTGRRKDSVARVRVYTGTGKITINDRDIDNYFGLETLKLIVRSPLWSCWAWRRSTMSSSRFRRRCFRPGWRAIHHGLSAPCCSRAAMRIVLF